MFLKAGRQSANKFFWPNRGLFKYLHSHLIPMYRPNWLTLKYKLSTISSAISLPSLLDSDTPIILQSLFTQFLNFIDAPHVFSSQPAMLHIQATAPYSSRTFLTGRLDTCIVTSPQIPFHTLLLFSLFLPSPDTVTYVP